jgi:protein-S-isoprenylcysteine O-methyltransferase Ste14
MLPFRWYKKAFPIWVRALLFALVAPGAVAVLFPYLLLSLDWEWERLELGTVRLLGLPFMLLGGLAYLGCLWEFVSRGRGTPSPFDPPQKLVTGGLYRFVRNPMYVTVGCFLIGEILFFESLILLLFLLFLWLDFHLFIVLYEEPTLKRAFGSPYEDYLQGVPRWIPRLRSSGR